MTDEPCKGVPAVGPNGWTMPGPANPFEIYVAASIRCPACQGSFTTWQLAAGQLRHKPREGEATA